MQIRHFLLLVVAFLGINGSASTSRATTMFIDSFCCDGTLSGGRSVVSSVPNPNTIPGIHGEIPGRAFAFDAPRQVAIVSIDIGLSFISGSRDVLVSIHESELQEIPYAPHRVRTIPSAVLAQDLLAEVLPDERAYITWNLATPLVIDSATEYFLSVTTVPGDDPSRFGWHFPVPARRSHTGSESAFQHPDRSWGSYRFNSFRRGAFRIETSPVPEPSTAVLMILGLLGLSCRRCLAGPSRVHRAMAPSIP